MSEGHERMEDVLMRGKNWAWGLDDEKAFLDELGSYDVRAWDQGSVVRRAMLLTNYIKTTPVRKAGGFDRQEAVDYARGKLEELRG